MLFNRNIELSVKDVMSTEFLKVNPEDSLIHVFEMMAMKNRQEAFVVSKGKRGKILGIITLKDFNKIMQENFDLNDPVSDHMVTSVYICPPEVSAKEARNFMIKYGIGHLPIWDGEKIIGVVDSISLRDAYYAQLEELSKQLKEVIDQLYEGVCVADNEGTVILWNKSAERIYRIKSEEILGKKLKDYFPDALLNVVIDKKKPIENVTHSPVKGKYVVISAKPLWFGDYLVGAVSSEVDITEATKLSSELEEVNNRIKYFENEYKKVIEEQYQFGDKIVSKSKKFTDAIRLAQQVSKSDASVLITGESGTGKEVFARGIHKESGRKGDFIAVNCSAIPSNLLESELFGYAGGAFTGALTKGKKGKFQLANEGTLFLDEIGEMPIDMQAKLLRVLQNGEIQPIGGEKTIKVNTRIISATNRNLEQMMEEGLFRKDLYYRLNVITIYLPPLRERKEDINLLINQFFDEYSKIYNKKIDEIPPEILQILTDYEWPGNIRELKNTIERLVILSNNGILKKNMLPTKILENEKTNNSTFTEEYKEYNLTKVLEDTEIKLINKVMKITKRNKTKAAEILDIPRGTLYYKLRKYQIEE